jgi:hypothetical protein
LLTLQQIQRFETDFAKDLYKAAEIKDLSGTNAEAMKEVRKLLGIHFEAPIGRLIPGESPGQYIIGQTEVIGLEQP